MSAIMTSDGINRVLLGALDNHIRAALRERIQAFIQPDIDAAIDAAMGTFKAAIERDFEVFRDEHVVRVLLSDRREHKAEK